MDIDPSTIPNRKDYDDLVQLISNVATSNDAKKLKRVKLEFLNEELEIVKRALDLIEWICDISTGKDGSAEPKKERLEVPLEELSRLIAELSRTRKKREKRIMELSKK